MRACMQEWPEEDRARPQHQVPVRAVIQAAARAAAVRRGARGAAEPPRVLLRHGGRRCGGPRMTGRRPARPAAARDSIPSAAPPGCGAERSRMAHGRCASTGHCMRRVCFGDLDDCDCFLQWECSWFVCRREVRGCVIVQGWYGWC